MRWEQCLCCRAPWSCLLWLRYLFNPVATVLKFCLHHTEYSHNFLPITHTTHTHTHTHTQMIPLALWVEVPAILRQLLTTNHRPLVSVKGVQQLLPLSTKTLGDSVGAVILRGSGALGVEGGRRGEERKGKTKDQCIRLQWREVKLEEDQGSRSSTQSFTFFPPLPSPPLPSPLLPPLPYPPLAPFSLLFPFYSFLHLVILSHSFHS